MFGGGLGMMNGGARGFGGQQGGAFMQPGMMNGGQGFP